MILIADSGTTKTDWRLIQKNGQIIQIKTQGISPTYQNQEEILKTLQNELLSQVNAPIEKVFFYGTGCSVPDKAQIVNDAIQIVFPQAVIEVEHDLLAAARALCGQEAGIACILGTGSNASLYDGKDIISNENNLGYILGDEGGGVYFGKKLIVAFLHKTMPEDLYEKFKARYQTTRDEVIDNVYKKPLASRYLASFSQFLIHHIHEPYCYSLIREGFEAFLRIYVCSLADYQNHKIHFVGSIAFYYSNILRQVAQDMSLTVGNIIETPIAGLTLYHQVIEGVEK